MQHCCLSLAVYDVRLNFRSPAAAETFWVIDSGFSMEIEVEGEQGGSHELEMLFVFAFYCIIWLQLLPLSRTSHMPLLRCVLLSLSIACSFVSQV